MSRDGNTYFAVLDATVSRAYTTQLTMLNATPSHFQVPPNTDGSGDENMRRGLIFIRPVKYIFINLLLLVLFISLKKHENSAIFMDALIVRH